MNSQKKTSPHANLSSGPRNQTPGQKAAAIQRNGISARPPSLRSAPAVYRPNPMPLVLQKSVVQKKEMPQKSSSRIQPRQIVVQAKDRRPAPPAVYRPQPVPRVLQLKKANSAPKPAQAQQARSPKASTTIQRVEVGHGVLKPRLDTTIERHKAQLDQYFAQTAQRRDLDRLTADLNAIVAENGYNADYYAPRIRAHIQQLQVRDVKDDPNYRFQNVANCVLYVDGRIAQRFGNYVSNQGAQQQHNPYVRSNENTEMEKSARDSEVAMLNDVDIYLTQNVNAIQNNVVVKIVSKNGSCDGCKERIRQFQTRINNLWRGRNNGRALFLRIEYTHLELPRDLIGARVGSTYGYHTDRFDMDVTTGGNLVLTHPDETGVHGNVEMPQAVEFMEQDATYGLRPG